MEAPDQHMNVASSLAILPYSALVGQKDLRLALEIAYVTSGIGGVLISGERGTAKSTAVRAFCRMAYGALPVTLPINATDDRVLGGWHIDELMKGEAKLQRGLLQEAHERLLYIDEVNLLDDHLVNLILDVASTGLLTVQREGMDVRVEVKFTLVGTMNPEEGGLRPQLLDRFGLMVLVDSLGSRDERRAVLEAVLEFDAARAADAPTEWLLERLREDGICRERLERARAAVTTLPFAPGVASLCADIADAFGAAGHRGDYVSAMAARAKAAIDDAAKVEPKHVFQVAPLALVHRRHSAFQTSGKPAWTVDDSRRLRELVDDVER
jgi:magnesium chelatase subunit I